MNTYIGNAFSAGMLAENCDVSFSFLTQEAAASWVMSNRPISCIGHADTADLVTELLGSSVTMNRISTELQVGDQMLVAQYNGPRLPEGAKSLPEGAKIRWILARVREERYEQDSD